MLRWRLLLGTVFIVALVGLFWWDHQSTPPGLVLLPLACLLSILASREMVWLLAARDLRPLPWVVYLGNPLLVISSAAPFLWPSMAGEVMAMGPAGMRIMSSWPLITFAMLVLIAFVGEMRRYEKPGQVMERLALTVLSLAYVGLLLGFVVQLRFLPLTLFTVNETGDITGLPLGRLGVPAIASLVIVVKMCDIGAYTVGRLIGRHKMAPVLSPGKTWEGAGGGLAFACLGSWITFTWLIPAMASDIALKTPIWGWLAFGLLIGIAGMLGDLAESLIKRDVGRKDSSDWMPGFGGVLDLLDSILFAAPVAYLCWVTGLVRG